MTSPETLHTALVARLGTLSTVTTYEAQVPTKPPANTAGQVFPYAVVWPSAGYTPDAARSVTVDAQGALEWPAQVTVVAGQRGWCLDAAHLVRQALEGHVLVPGVILREQQGVPGMQVDRDPSPVRFYVPIIVRALTA